MKGRAVDPSSYLAAKPPQMMRSSLASRMPTVTHRSSLIMKANTTDESYRSTMTNVKYGSQFTIRQLENPARPRVSTNAITA